MLFHSSLRKELGRNFGATLVVLITIVMTMLLIRSLGQASRGQVNPSEVILIMGYAVLGYLPVILTMALCISIVGTLSRMHTDSEMVIWFSAGRGLASFVLPLLRFAWPVLLVIALLSLWVWPWTNQQAQQLRESYQRRGDLDRVAPGQFQESSDGQRVFFIDKDSAKGTQGRNVFIAAREPNGAESITSARTGRIESMDSERVLMLERGQRLESRTSPHALRISEFEQLGVRIGEVTDPGPSTQARAMSSLALLKQPIALHLGEMSWRLGLALSAFNVVLLSMAVANVSPRAGRNGNLLFAVFFLMLYLNLINLGQSWISTHKVGALNYMVALHGGALLLALIWLSKHHRAWSVRAWISARLLKPSADKAAS